MSKKDSLIRCVRELRRINNSNPTELIGQSDKIGEWIEKGLACISILSMSEEPKDEERSSILSNLISRTEKIKREVEELERSPDPERVTK